MVNVSRTFKLSWGTEHSRRKCPIPSVIKENTNEIREAPLPHSLSFQVTSLSGGFFGMVTKKFKLPQYVFSTIFFLRK